MARPRKPDHLLTPEQQKRRLRNERYRGTPRVVLQSEAKSRPLTLVPNSYISEDGLTVDVSQTKEKRPVSNSKIPDQASPVKQSQMTQHPSTLLATLLFRSALLAISASILILCCVLSFHLQVEVYETLKILPPITIMGVGVYQVTAALVEILLVIFAGIALHGNGPGERSVAMLLFLLVGGGTCALMFHGQEVQLETTKQVAAKAISSQREQDSTTKRIANERDSLSLQRDTLLRQVDTNQKGSFASVGAVGLVASTLTKLEATNSAIAKLNSDLAAIDMASKKDFLPYSSQAERTTVFAELLRLALLVVTAFLVHVFLSRLAALRGKLVEITESYPTGFGGVRLFTSLTNSG